MTPRLSASQVRFATGEPSDEQARSQFDQQLACELPQLLDDDLAAMVERLMTKAVFESDAVAGIGHRRVEVSGVLAGALNLALGRPDMLRWVADITSSEPLTAVNGSVAQFEQSSVQSLDWHDDCAEDRRVAITIDLGAQFSGGELELRDAGSQRIIFRHAHRTVGNGLIFAIRPSVEHRVLPVTGGGPRTTYSGWFIGGPGHA